MEALKFSPLMSLACHSHEYAVAWYGMRSAHEAKKLNTHSLSRSRTTSSGSLPLRASRTGSPTGKENADGPLKSVARLLPFPLELKCNVIVELGKKQKTHDDVVHWMDYEQYMRVKERCHELLDELLGDLGVNVARKSRFLKSGILKLFTRDRDSSNDTLLALERCHYDRDWMYHVPMMALKFGLKYHPHQELFLRLEWSCDFIPVSINPKESLSDLVWDRMHERLERNKCWREKNFLSRNETDAIFTDEVVEALIFNANGLISTSGPLKASERANFVKKVQLKGTRLLAICIYGRLPLQCLYKLLQCDIEDANLPVDMRTLPEAARGRHCDHLGLFQHRFVPFDFQLAPENGQTFHQLSDDTVIPMFVGKMLGEGGYGEVFEVEIHPEHHNFTPVRKFSAAVEMLLIISEPGSSIRTETLYILRCYCAEGP